MFRKLARKVILAAIAILLVGLGLGIIVGLLINASDAKPMPTITATVTAIPSSDTPIPSPSDTSAPPSTSSQAPVPSPSRTPIIKGCKVKQSETLPQTDEEAVLELLERNKEWGIFTGMGMENLSEQVTAPRNFNTPGFVLANFYNTHSNELRQRLTLAKSGKCAALVDEELRYMELVGERFAAYNNARNENDTARMTMLQNMLNEDAERHEFLQRQIA